MILDSLDNAALYVPMHPGFRAAFDYLRRTPLANLSDGRHEIDASRLYLIMAHAPCNARPAAVMAAHRTYIDSQIPLNLREEMGWSPLPLCRQTRQAYDEAKDAALFADPPQSWIAVAPGNFIVFFPNDAHAPLAGEGVSHKAVIKIAVDW